MGKVGLWSERPIDGARTAELEKAGLLPLVARVLAARGVAAEGLDAFFQPSVERLLPPEGLPGILDAVRVILPFVRERRKIVVFGDYDVDGVCASAILVTALRRILSNGRGDEGASGLVDAFIPHRFNEGYGMTEASLRRLLDEHPDVALVITVDNGITSPDEIAGLRRRGIAVVVTDHHLPGDRIPVADALVNPRVASVPGCEDLCGAGVAFFLAHALARAAAAQGLYSGGKFAGPLLVLAGLATVVDLVALVGQNRVLVTQSLSVFHQCAPVGLRELLLRAARSANALAARDYGFTLGPRINAAGRMASARLSYDLLMCPDREAARRLAMQVDDLNVLRKTEEQRVDHEARVQLKDAEPGTLAAVVVRDEGWNVGVAGIAAARLMETYHVPVAVAAGDTGSARTPEGYNVQELFAAASNALERFGGHAAAGGFTLRPGAFESFRAAFTAACENARANLPAGPEAVFDGWVEPADLTLELCESLQRLAPFGIGNPEPVFGLRNVAFSDITVMGQEGRHLSFAFVHRGIPRAVWWGHGADAENLRAHAAGRFDVLFTPITSDYGSPTPYVELRLVALRPTCWEPTASNQET